MKKLRVKKSIAKGAIVIALIFLLIGILAFIQAGLHDLERAGKAFERVGRIMIVGSIILFIRGWSRQFYSPVILYDHHIEIKAGFIAPLKMIRFEEISYIQKTSKGRFFLILKTDQRISIPMVSLDEEDQWELMSFLKQKFEIISIG
jgi:ABC-type Na+ efflux pump permease subunit